MLSYRFVLTACLLLAASFCNAQIPDVRYFDEIFDEVKIDEGVVYGRNYERPSVTLEFPYPIDLKADVYQAEADQLQERPVVIVAHGGYFFNALNDGLSYAGIPGGSRQDSVVVEICKRLAKRGFVAISYDFRANWNCSDSSDLRLFGYADVLYRGLQDTHTLLRWIQKSAIEEGNPYGFDVESIAMLGEGSGGMLAYATATIDDVGDFLIDELTYLDDEENVSFAINPYFMGDIDGKGYPEPTDTNYVWYHYPDSDSVPGHAINIPNHLEYQGEIDFAFSCGGALLFPQWINADSKPCVAVHCLEDPHTPIFSGDFFIPGFEQLTLPMQGSGIVIPLLNEIGANDVLNEIQYLDDYSLAAEAAILNVPGLVDEPHIYPLATTSSVPDSAPWQWWDEEFWSQYSFTDLDEEGELVQEIVAESFNEIQPDQSAERGRAYVDTILNYFCPRAAQAMGLPEIQEYLSFTAIEEYQPKEIKIIPNPIKDEVFIEGGSDLIDHIQLFDISGKFHSEYSGNKTSIYFDRESIKPGVYLMLIFIGDDVVREKVIFD